MRIDGAAKQPISQLMVSSFADVFRYVNVCEEFRSYRYALLLRPAAYRSTTRYISYTLHQSHLSVASLISATAAASHHTGVCEKNTPPEKKTLGTISLQSTKSGAGEGFLLLGRMANARAKGVFFHRHRYLPQLLHPIVLDTSIADVTHIARTHACRCIRTKYPPQQPSDPATH